ncbi:MAG: carbamate kinase [Rhodobacteraceae bacterium]|nr:carbamate kinase [Paracoccaceae bacterium]
MRLVVALGGNALLKRGEPLTAGNQRANVRHAAGALVDLIKAGHSLIVTHGNGPQVGLLALQSEAGPADGFQPLDVLDAESEGMVGYLIEQEMASLLPDRQFATILTQILVAADDPAFGKPTKPIGPSYSADDARRLAAAHGWSVAQDGRFWRRVVASPRPLEILERSVIALLVDQGTTVICSGGGGIPVIRRRDGSLSGVEAVIDKDFASALLASQLGADMLLLLTDVDAVYTAYGAPEQQRIRRIDPDRFVSRDFPAGSMRPKIEAAIQFAGEPGRAAAIGRLDDAVRILNGTRGTRIAKGAP